MAKKAKVKKAKVWLCNSIPQGYEIFPLRGRPVGEGSYYFQGDSNGHDTAMKVCAQHFERKFPHLKLAPDSPPRRVEITMKFCD